MVITLTGKSGTAMLLGGYGSAPLNIAIGSASGTSLNTLSGLRAEFDTLAFTGSPNTSVERRVTYTVDYNAVGMSGNTLGEFAVTNGSPTTDIWSYDNLGNTVTFDGTSELRIEVTFRVY